MDNSRRSRGESKYHLLRWGSTRRYRCQNPEPQPESNNTTTNNNKAAAAAVKRERERGTPASPDHRRSLLIRIPVKPTTDDKQQQQQGALPPTEPHWNLRSRAAAAAKIKLSSSSSSAAAAAAGEGEGEGQEEKKKKKKKKPAVFWFSLSKEEIEADFLAMTGSKPPPRRYANRRPRTLQNEIDCLSPGFLLPATVDANTYQVAKFSSQY